VKVATKLALGFALHSLLLAMLLVYHVRALRDTVSAGQELTAISARVFSIATEQTVRIAQLEENAAKHVVTRDSGYVAKFEELSDAFAASLDALGTQPLSAHEADELAGLHTAWAAFRLTSRRLDSFAAAPDPADPLSVLQVQLDTLRVRSQRMSDASYATMLGQLRSSAATARRAERVSGVAWTLVLLLGVATSILIVRSITDALNRLAEGTREVAHGRFAHRLDASRDDEFAQLARDFNAMTERLEELDRMKRDFVSKVSHDLKTPLASMQETIDVLLDGLPGPLLPRQRRLLELNRQSGNRLYAMVGKLLDLSSLESGAVEPHFEEVDLRALARAVADEQSRGEAAVRVSAPEPVIAVCDADRMTQLLQNLVENALKFAATPGGVSISVQRVTGAPAQLLASHDDSAPHGAAANVHIVVSDDGPGVPDEEKQRIFDRFFQGAAGREATARGVGLGLTICREIVLVHRGTLWVQDGPEGGSEFHVLLPAPARVPPSLAPAGRTTEVAAT
jgi:signal transduction histidine kinase